MSTLLGRTITEIRPMTDDELTDYGWGGESGLLILLDDGTALIPSQDEEGNGPGVIFVATREGEFLLHGVR